MTFQIHSQIMDKLPISLAFNCGYARVAGLEYSFLVPGRHRSSIDRKKRIDKFKNIFQGYENFARPAEFWENEHKSTFNRYCDSILDDSPQVVVIGNLKNFM